MKLDPELIGKVDAAEEELERMGLREFRVRLDAPGVARIEVAEAELEAVAGKDNRSRLVKKLRGLGFRRILLDLEGYRCGSMDEPHADAPRRTLDIAKGTGG
jgi:uncharacterized protein